MLSKICPNLRNGYTKGRCFWNAGYFCDGVGNSNFAKAYDNMMRKLNRMTGDALANSGLDGFDGIHSGETRQISEEHESSYEQHRGTEFASRIRKMTPSITTKYVSRQEVYDLIDSSPYPEKRAGIRTEIDGKFPERNLAGKRSLFCRH